MLHDKVVNRTPVERGRKIRQPFLSEIRIHRIENKRFLVFDEIRVVRHAARDDILTFKQIDRVVVDADVDNIIRNFHSATLYQKRRRVTEVL
jgi:hypothetical protein